MKKTILRSSLLIVFLSAIFFTLHAQSDVEIIKEKVNESLATHINKIYPPKGCQCNDCAYFYKNSFKFTKNMKVGNVIRLWGKAVTTYRNSRTGGNATVNFYVEVKKEGGDINVTKLKWQKDPCMKMLTLFDAS